MVEWSWEKWGLEGGVESVEVCREIVEAHVGQGLGETGDLGNCRGRRGKRPVGGQEP